MTVKIEHSTDFKKLLMSAVDDKIYRTACLDSIALISERIQNKGLDSSERKIENRSPKTPKAGAYSKFYAEIRGEAGRQTGYVDLTFTGEMMDSLDFEKSSQNEYQIGFNNKAAADKAEWNEERFGDVFSLSESEIKLVGQAIENNVGEAIG